MKFPPDPLIVTDGLESISGNAFCAVQAAQGTIVNLTIPWSYDTGWKFAGRMIIPSYHVSQIWTAAWADESWNASKIEGPPYYTPDPIYAFGALNFTYSNITGELEVSGTTCEVDIFADIYDVEVLIGKVTPKLRQTSELTKEVVTLAQSNSNLSSSTKNLCFQPKNSEPLNFTTLDALDQLDWATDLTVALTQQPFAWCKALISFDHKNVLNDTLLANVSASWYTLNVPDKPIQNLTASDFVMTRDDIDDFAIPSISEYVFLHQGHQHILNNLAQSLTTMAFDPQRNVNGTKPITGKAGNVVNLVHVRWQWLTLPYALCLTAIFLLIATISIQRGTNAPLWKCSINALFYHGIDFEFGIASQLSTIPEMDEQAMATRVRLRPSGFRQRLMLETSVARNIVNN